MDTRSDPEGKVQLKDLSGTSILITGGTTGIGRATAIRLAASGARVMVFGRNEPELNEALEDIKAYGEVTGLTADISKPADVQRVFSEVDRTFGNLDILVSCAALPAQSLMSESVENCEYVVNTNLTGAILSAKMAIERMKANSKGHIVFVGSMSAEVREADSSLYTATKSGIRGLAGTLRKEVNDLGIKVTLIEPGLVGTDLIGKSQSEQEEQQAEYTMMKAEDIAETIYYTLIQPERVDVVMVQVRPHRQLI